MKSAAAFFALLVVVMIILGIIAGFSSLKYANTESGYSLYSLNQPLAEIYKIASIASFFFAVLFHFISKALDDASERMDRTEEKLALLLKSKENSSSSYAAKTDASVSSGAPVSQPVHASNVAGMSVPHPAIPDRANGQPASVPSFAGECKVPEVTTAQQMSLNHARPTHPVSSVAPVSQPVYAPKAAGTPVPHPAIPDRANGQPASVPPFFGEHKASKAMLPQQTPLNQSEPPHSLVSRRSRIQKNNAT